MKRLPHSEKGVYSGMAEKLDQKETITRLVTWIFFAIALFSFDQVSSAEMLTPAVELQVISFTLFPERSFLSGESAITISGAAGKMTFALSPAATIERVTVAGAKGSFSFTGGNLTLDLPPESLNKTVNVIVGYHAVFNDIVPKHPVNDEDPTFGVTGTISPEGTFLGEGAGWYPIPPVTTLRRVVTIIAPAGTEAVTSGKRVSRETKNGLSRSTWVEDRPVGNLSLAAGPYLIEGRLEKGVLLSTYFYHDNAPLSRRYLDASSR